MILYKDIRTPGQTELFYKEAQSDPGVMLTKAEIDGVDPGRRRQAADRRQGHPPGRNVLFEADLVVLATGLVPVTT